ncbi:hypothetical protein [Amycolatopsis antarctica]|uniref:hypothetical protein n=1 Tax=Amycolatopsis antarctica TaxID=1854586 RepID=UPI001054FB26|nr:hypothetical protein [Amycolatopsis antarctica]
MTVPVDLVNETAPVRVPNPPVWSGSADGGDGQTVVSVEAIRHVANSMTSLEEPLRRAIDDLRGVDIRPGGFYHATAMRTAINGANSDGGLKSELTLTLTSILQGVVDIRDAMETMAARYTSTDQQNTLAATDVQRLMAEAAGEFTQASGGSGAAAPPVATDSGVQQASATGSGTATGGSATTASTRES